MSLGEAERETERERIPGRLHIVSTEPHMGLELTKPRGHDLSPNQESDTAP